MLFAEDNTKVKVFAEQLIKDSAFAEECVCKICQVHVVGCGPKLTKCSHLFCGDCLEKWFEVHPGNQTWAQRAKTGGAVPCPVCKTMLQKGSDIYPVEKDGDENSAFLWQMIQQLKVRCDGRNSVCAEGCCSWTGEYGAFFDHLQSGLCGQIMSSPEAEAAIILQEEPIVLPKVTDDESERHSFEAESTCSQCSCESSLEELSAEDANDSSDAESKPLPETMEDTDPSSVAGLVGKDLASLIQAYVDIEATKCSPSLLDKATAEADSDATLPASSASKSETAAVPQPVLHENRSKQAATLSTDVSEACSEKAKKPKAKGKKSKVKAGLDTKDADEQAQAKAAQQWQSYQYQAYQWQAAQYQRQAAQYQRQAAQYQQYQMACAYQYQMAVRSAQMQQALQCQQRMHSKAK